MHQWLSYTHIMHCTRNTNASMLIQIHLQCLITLWVQGHVHFVQGYTITHLKVHLKYYTPAEKYMEAMQGPSQAHNSPALYNGFLTLCDTHLTHSQQLPATAGCTPALCAHIQWMPSPASLSPRWRSHTCREHQGHSSGCPRSHPQCNQ